MSLEPPIRRMGDEKGDLTAGTRNLAAGQDGIGHLADDHMGWVWMPALFCAAAQIVHQRIDARSGNVRAKSRIPARVEQRALFAIFCKSLPSIMKRRVHAFSPHVRIAVEIPGAIKQG